MAREQLEALFGQGKYYFHGSTESGLTELRPQQAYSYGRPDSEPAVYAAYGIDPAIFVAVLGKRGNAGWNSQRYGGVFGFYVARSSYEQAEEEAWAGTVYTVDRNDFASRGFAVSTSPASVKVIHEVSVSIPDLDMEIISVVDDANL